MPVSTRQSNAQNGTAASLDAYLRERRNEIERALVAALPSPPACPAVLGDAMRYSVTAGGKRLRPILCLAGADAVRGDRTLAMPCACAIELIHTYSLIHDDLPAMDNDTMRRGRPTLHVVAGEGMAILGGDGLLTGALGMVGGQAIDLASVTPPPSGEALPPLDSEGLARMHAMKTGALIRAAARCGAIMGGGSDRQVDAIDAAAAELGLAYQIVDDILDVEGATADLGKTAGKDVASGKPTYPALYGVEASRRLAADCLGRAEGILRDVDIADPHLLAIGRWIVERSN